MASTADVIRKQLNEGLKQPVDYTYVNVLLLHWQGSNEQSADFQKEGQMLGEFFATKLGFSVTQYAIPLDNSDLFLQQRITDEVASATKDTETHRKKSLLIIHYGGHGVKGKDVDEAIWAPSETSQNGESLVHWSKIQNTLEYSKADVLILLDCCFSAQAGRAWERAGRIEIVTASSRKETTPLPGPKSFTSALVKVIEHSIHKDGYITVEHLQRQLLKRERGLLTTPVNIVLREGFPSRSIRIAPLGYMSTDVPDNDFTGPYIRLLIRTTELGQDNIEELTSWLRSDLPANVSLEVESVVKTVEAIQDVIKDIPQRSLSLVKGLHATTLNSILASWSTAFNLLAEYKARRYILKDQGMYIGQLEQQAQILLEKLQAQNAKIVDEVEQDILQSPETLETENLVNDPTADRLGITDQLRLKNMITYGDPAIGSFTKEIQIPGAPGMSVWKEYKVYGERLGSEYIPEVEARVKLLAELLTVSKRPAFSSLRCLRWYPDQPKKQFVLEFEIPDEYKSESGLYHSSSLKNVIKEEEKDSRPSLGQRFQMAYSIAKAIQKWHSVGWVHQSLGGHNVIFFRRNQQEIHYERPFLQGFDFARPNVSPSIGRYVDNVSDNVYRHPDRQGPVRKGHKKIHDIYSLGVVLLEIGLWEVARVTAGKIKGKDLEVQQMTLNLQEAATNRLAHYAGKDYQEAVLACLKSDFGVREDDEEGSRLSKAFQDKVLAKLDKSTHLR